MQIGQATSIKWSISSAPTIRTLSGHLFSNNSISIKINFSVTKRHSMRSGISTDISYCFHNRILSQTMQILFQLISMRNWQPFNSNLIDSWLKVMEGFTYWILKINRLLNLFILSETRIWMENCQRMNSSKWWWCWGKPFKIKRLTFIGL